MLDPHLIAAIGGMLVGLLLTVFGGGGSVLATPWLLYAVGVADVHIAIGTSAAAVDHALYEGVVRMREEEIATRRAGAGAAEAKR